MSTLTIALPRAAEAGQESVGQADVVVVDPLDADLVEQLQ
jgi:hypothetical protein